MDRTVLIAIYNQIGAGWDIPTPAGATKLRVELAVSPIDGMPYSVHTNLAHGVYWQERWLTQVTGGAYSPKVERWAKDWRVPSPDEWRGLRDEFVAGFAEAARIASSEPFEHGAADDAKAVELLLRIAIHASYHLGQINLLKQVVRGSS
jgi:hypothetical protein